MKGGPLSLLLLILMMMGMGMGMGKLAQVRNVASTLREALLQLCCAFITASHVVEHHRAAMVHAVCCCG